MAGFGTDHAAQAGSGCGEIVFEFGDAGVQGLVVCLQLLGCSGEFGVAAGEFVDAVDQVGFGDGVQVG